MRTPLQGTACVQWLMKLADDSTVRLHVSESLYVQPVDPTAPHAYVDDDEQMQLLGKHPAEVCAVLLQYAILSPPRDTLACRATVRGGWVETRYRQNLCGMWRAIEPVRGRFQTYDACRV